MGKKQKRLIKELEAALEVALEDYHAERTKRIAAELELDVMAGIVNGFNRDRQQAQAERDAALGHWQNTESLLQERERELDTLQAQHAEVSDARDDLLESLARANALIGNIRFQRDGLRGRCAALSDELDALKAAQAQQQEHASQWGALCFRLGIAEASHIDTVIDAARAQAAPAEPVVTLDALYGLKPDGRKLVGIGGVEIEHTSIGYRVRQPEKSWCTWRTPEEALQYYRAITKE